MDLHILWFGLIVILFCGFFLLEGFDFGVGMLMPFLGKNDVERRTIISAIGPFWDGNEVWLITAGGAMFAAFPDWYATLFSGFYIVMFLVLLALILRGAALEFRGKDKSRSWRRFWDWAVMLGSALPGFLWGIIFANCLLGVPIDEKMNFVGNFWQLFNPYALVCGLAVTAMFLLHGAIFLDLKLEGKLRVHAGKMARLLWLPTISLVVVFVSATYLLTDALARLSIAQVAVTLGVASALIAVFWLLQREKSGWAFVMTSLALIGTVLALYLQLFPRMMVSSLNPAWSLTIYNASSSQYTLTVMSWVALTFIPFVLAYQAWNYWVFRKRISVHASSHY
ncbi:cytochrome d ubiquinol oxidase subunit II [Ktedonosporobacter rubrisoli]|uniref:Cytochrome d ubiquinol oxidase subunit II n=1 Tax=Ktedonosporobacter rubrisoli TaxID=2509675 RepID=A0A4P6JTJ1_KTERU|nr:cytochrome d ubiquinol oxidase subunit II [Ktedonosporobacter rubrisoli]QBD78764.1 cytochrome d ubiquinol oxidase subunit II [Ktedonosporobacter rubrisoli]